MGKNKKSSVNTELFSDLDWIQTSNLLSRNQMRYSVAPRGLKAGANITSFFESRKSIFKFLSLLSTYTFQESLGQFPIVKIEREFQQHS